MATYNNGKEVRVGDPVKLDGRVGTVTRVPSGPQGNESPVVAEFTVQARALEPV